MSTSKRIDMLAKQFEEVKFETPTTFAPQFIRFVNMVETLELTPEDIHGIVYNFIANGKCEKCGKDPEELILWDEGAIYSCKECVPEFTKRWQELQLETEK